MAKGRKKRSLPGRAARIAALLLLKKHIAKREFAREEKMVGRGRIRRQISAQASMPEKMLFRALGGRDRQLTAISRKAVSAAAANAGLLSPGEKRKTGVGKRLGKSVARYAAGELTKKHGEGKRGLRRFLK